MRKGAKRQGRVCLSRPKNIEVDAIRRISDFQQIVVL
jgi:hypothetical protein